MDIKKDWQVCCINFMIKKQKLHKPQTKNLKKENGKSTQVSNKIFGQPN